MLSMVALLRDGRNGVARGECASISGAWSMRLWYRGRARVKTERVQGLNLKKGGAEKRGNVGTFPVCRI